MSAPERSPRRGLTRRGLLQAGGAGALATTLPGCANDDFEPQYSRTKDGPNVLLIVTDSTRADYIGAYNRKTIARTPNIDALSREGLTFDLSVPESMPTGPVRRCIHSGMRGFPFRDWVLTEGLPVDPGWMPIRPDQPVLADVLGESGVRTGYATDNPFLIGPLFANVRRALDAPYPQYSQGAYRFLNKPFTRPATRSETDRFILPVLSDTVEATRMENYVGWNQLFRRSERAFSSARVIRSGMKALERFAGKGPFFLGVDLFDPHEPFDPPPIYLDRFGPQIGSLAARGIEPVQPFETPSDPVDKLDINAGDLTRVRQLYAAELTHVDKWIGRLLNKLDDLGLAEDTVVWYTSDHGVTLGEQGVIGKSRSRINYPIYHVPNIIRHPEGKRAGERDSYFAQTHDIARTICSFSGVRAPGRMNGEDLSVLFDGGQPPERRYFTSVYADYFLAGDGRYILISDAGERDKRLYDTQEDPQEVRDIASRNPEKVDELWRALEDEAGGTLPQFGDQSALGG